MPTTTYMLKDTREALLVVAALHALSAKLREDAGHASPGHASEALDQAQTADRLAADISLTVGL
jgi:hypothetical protein